MSTTTITPRALQPSEEHAPDFKGKPLTPDQKKHLAALTASIGALVVTGVLALPSLFDKKGESARAKEAKAVAADTRLLVRAANNQENVTTFEDIQTGTTVTELGQASNPDAYGKTVAMKKAVDAYIADQIPDNASDLQINQDVSVPTIPKEDLGKIK